MTQLKKVNFDPLGTKVLIEPVIIKKEVKTSGGILLENPDNKEEFEAPIMGTVLGKGDEATYVKPGDVVLFNAGSGKDVMVGEHTFLLMREGEIDGIFR